MNKLFLGKLGMVLIVTFAATVNVFSFAEHASDPDPAMDEIERSLELERHERLIKRITESDVDLSRFTTDGCSGGLSVGWEKLAGAFPEFSARHGTLPPWQECCVTHDRQYHAGGSGVLSAIQSFEQRKQADIDLENCVTETGLQRSAVLQEMYGLTDSQIQDIYAAISELMYRAVRVGGIPCTDQPWRWGYGWPDCDTHFNDNNR